MASGETVPRERRRDVASWAGVAVAIAGLAVVAWALLTSWGGVVHSHPAYLVLLCVGAAAAALALTLTIRRRRRRGGLLLVGRLALAVVGAAGVALLAWLRPYPAGDAAVEALRDDDEVVAVESAGEIVLSPQGEPSDVGILFQPGALVDPRAYAPLLRPLAEAGHTVVIVKQPLGIGFLATGALEAARSAHPDPADWIVGGHSLGGTVAAMTADDHDVAGLLLYASYPAGDLSSLDAPVLSVSGSRDGLATPEKIDASRSDLPFDAAFVVIDGGSHAQFGDYGAQAGDGTPTIGDAEAHARIASATADFVARISG